MYSLTTQSYGAQDVSTSEAVLFPGYLPGSLARRRLPAQASSDGTLAPSDEYTRELLGLPSAYGDCLEPYALKKNPIHVVVVPKGGGKPVRTTANTIQKALTIFKKIKASTPIPASKPKPP